MIPSLSQEELTQYASDAQAIQEPTGTDFSKGAAVGKTIPAKWWNWLFFSAFKRLSQSREDADNVLTEMKNVLVDDGTTPTAADGTQLSQSIVSRADRHINSYIERVKYRYGATWVQPQMIYADAPTGTTVVYSNYFNRKSSTLGYVHFMSVQVFSGTDVSDTPVSTRLIYSLDCINWFTLLDGITPADLSALTDSDAAICIIGEYCYYFTRSYFTGVSANRVQLTGASIPSSAWFSLEALQADISISYHTFMTVLNDSIFYMSSEGNLYKYSNDSNSAIAVTAPEGLGSQRTTGTYWFNMIEPVPITGYYLVGSVRVSLDGSVWEPLFQLSYALYQLRPYYLRNGSIVFDNVSDGHGYDAPARYLDANGTLHTLSEYGLYGYFNKWTGGLCSQCLEDCALLVKGGELFVTYDFEVFTAVPSYSNYSLRSIAQKGDYCYLGYFGSSNKTFYKKGTFSSDLADYTLMDETTDLDAFLSIPDSEYLYAYPDNIVTDGSLLLHDMTIAVNFAQPAGYPNITLSDIGAGDNKMYARALAAVDGITNNGSTVYYISVPVVATHAVNYVKGHTLYFV